MARFIHLPIYKKTYDLALFIHRMAINLPREHRYTFGAKLKDYILELLMLIVRANAKTTKVAALEQALERLEELKILVRIGKDLKIIGIGKYEECSRLFDDIGKQLGGWIKSQKTPESNNSLPAA